MQMDTRVVIHAGYPKTATTTLQRHFFPSHPEIEYLGKTIPDMAYVEPALKTEIDRLTNEDEVRYDGGERLRRIIQRYRNRCDHKVLLISHENFIHPWANDKGLIAKRLRSVFGPCRILITLRSQVDLIRSFYGMAGRYGKSLFVAKSENEPLRIPLTLDRWFQLVMRAPERNILGILHYYDMIRYYMSLFGSSNVGVLLFEEFVHSRASFMEKLSNFLGIDTNEGTSTLIEGKHENRRFSRVEKAYLRLSHFLGLNGFDWSRRDAPLLVRMLKSVLGEEEVHLGEKWENYLFDTYGEGNRKLADQYGLPLERFGYPMAPARLNGWAKMPALQAA